MDGLLVQLPVPPHIRERTICDAVAPQKDVDGFNIMNVGRFCVDEKSFIPATPAAVMEMIKRTGVTDVLVSVFELFLSKCCYSISKSSKAHGYCPEKSTSIGLVSVEHSLSVS